ncbi:MAG: TetR/AcrR family transcriptional regulator [Solirubrobacteraceae bacterium]
MPPVSQSAGTRRRLTFEARREQLLDVATRLVAEHSFHVATVEAVARAAGVSRAIIYQHFGDLHGLMQAVMDRELARAHAQVSETTLTDLREGDPMRLMLESLRAFLTAVHDHPVTWRLVLMPPEGAPEVLRQRIELGRASVRARMTAAVGPLLQSESEGADAELTADVLSAISDEYARLLIGDPSRYPPERLIAHAQWWLGHRWGNPTPVARCGRG